MKNEFTVLDIFAGAGGLSEGFFNTGFNFISHIEMNKYASLTLETRALYHALRNKGMDKYYRNYLAGRLSREGLFNKGREIFEPNGTGILNHEISSKNEKSIKKAVKKRMSEMGTEGVDIIIGGPPCQAYSIIGRSRDSNRMTDDPRNYLYLHYLSFLRYFKPHIFVFENVPGIKSARKGSIFSDFKRRAKRLGYTVEERTLDAADFFVLQRRKRVIVMGWKSKYDFEYPVFSPVEHNFRVSDILNDLPSLEPGEGTESPQKYTKPPSEYMKKSGLRTKRDVLIQHNARIHNDRDREIYRYVISIWKKEHRRVKYDELPDKLKTHRNRKSFEDRFKMVASDSKYSHSVVAHISKDGHYYIHPDFSQARSLTVREVARIQSFPDNFKFEGPRTSQFRQVGNAVPPLMAAGIAEKVRNMLGEI